MEVAGINGCRAGWLVARVLVSERLSPPDVWVAPTFEDVMASTSRCAAVAVDIPIGLTEGAAREPDLRAREVLRPSRASSVFPAPTRPLLRARTYERACAISSRVSGKRISRQSYALIAKIKEADRVMTPQLQRRVVEVHPEVCFWALNANWPLANGKRTPAGAKERLRLLRNAFDGDLSQVALRRGFSRDDFLDACAAAWTAARFARGEAQTLPPDPPRDSNGLLMRIVY